MIYDTADDPKEDGNLYSTRYSFSAIPYNNNNQNKVFYEFVNVNGSGSNSARLLNGQ